MNLTASVLQGLGVALSVPAFVFILGTGDRRLLRFKGSFEQKLIDWSTPILVASIVGDLAFLGGVAIEGHWLVFALFVIMDIGSTVLLVDSIRHAQWDLDYRNADPAGFFWCRDCQEVHHIDGGCYADEDSEESHG